MIVFVIADINQNWICRWILTAITFAYDDTTMDSMKRYVLGP